MNLKGFKKLSEDGKTTIMLHPQGHEIKVVHSALSPEMRSRLKDLPLHKKAMGGAVKPIGQSDQPVVDYGSVPVKSSPNQDTPAASKPDPSAKLNNLRDPNYSDVVVPMADGGDTTPPKNIPSTTDENGKPMKSHAPWMNQPSEAAPSLPTADAPSGSWLYRMASAIPDSFFVPGGKQQMLQEHFGNPSAQAATPTSSGDAQAAEPAPADNTPDLFSSTKRAIQNTPAAQAPQESIPGFQDQLNKLVPNPAPPSAPPGASASSPQYPNNYQGQQQSSLDAQLQALDLQKQADLAKNQVNANASQQEAANELDYQNKAQTAQDIYNQNFQKYMGEFDKTYADISNGHIDPDEYINNMSTGKRIFTGIGLLLGGMGSGLTKGPNLAWESLQNNINRDIQGQEANLGAKENLLGFNLRETGNLEQAQSMTNLQMQAILGSKFRQNAANTQNQMLASNNLGVESAFKQKAAEISHQMALQDAMWGTPGAGKPSSDLDFQNRIQFLQNQPGEEGKKAAAFLQSHHMTGMPGITSNPVAPSDNEYMQNMVNIRKLLNQAQGVLSNTGALGAGWVAGHTPSFLGGGAGPEVQAQAKAISDGLALEIPKFLKFSGLRGEEANAVRGLVPDIAGTHFTGGDQAKLSLLNKMVDDHYNTFLRDKGYPTPSSSGTPNLQGNSLKLYNWAKQHPDDPRATQVLQKLGTK